jgi:hypothetical protein
VQSHDDAAGQQSGGDGRVPGRKATLAAIAAAAGVSLPTVSKVVNGRPDVAAGTRARVERLLEEHGYARPRAGRWRAGLIGLVLAEWPWAAEILRGVQDWSAAHETAVAVFPERRMAASAARRARGRTEPRPAGSAGPQRRRVRRPAGDGLVVAPDNDRAAAAGRDGQRRRPDARRPHRRQGALAEPGGVGHRSHRRGSTAAPGRTVC